MPGISGVCLIECSRDSMFVIFNNLMISCEAHVDFFSLIFLVYFLLNFKTLCGKVFHLFSIRHISLFFIWVYQYGIESMI